MYDFHIRRISTLGPELRDFPQVRVELKSIGRIGYGSRVGIRTLGSPRLTTATGLISA